jgi:enoyl-CoA hydratase/carnithine racemase
MPRYGSPYDPANAPRNLEHVIYRKNDHVAYVTINRPDVLNALHTYAYAELRACWRDMQIDPDVYCGIVTGTGKAFCAGRDVKFLAEHQAMGIRTPHEDPNSPLFFWGGGGQPSTPISKSR